MFLSTDQVIHYQLKTCFLMWDDYFKQTQKKINSDHQTSENLEQVNWYFNKLQTIIQEGGILPNDTCNMDETGFQIRMGKD